MLFYKFGLAYFVEGTSCSPSSSSFPSRVTLTNKNFIKNGTNQKKCDNDEENKFTVKMSSNLTIDGFAFRLRLVAEAPL